MLNFTQSSKLFVNGTRFALPDNRFQSTHQRLKHGKEGAPILNIHVMMIISKFCRSTTSS